MICITIHNKGYNEILEILSDPEVEMAEIRLDSCKLTQNEIEEIFRNCDLPLVATCRISSLVESLKSEIPEKSDSKIESQAFQISVGKPKNSVPILSDLTTISMVRIQLLPLKP